MTKMLIIYELIDWIERNIHQPLSIDDVSEKSGYTKWHLQRLFKQYSGYNLAEYIRARRLSTAAIELRFCRKRVFDIALEYGFDSMQSFSRAFKQRFGISPGQYRDQPHWILSGLCPPLNVPSSGIPIQPSVKSLPDLCLLGITVTSTCSFEDVVSRREQPGFTLWQTLFKDFRIIPPVAFGLSQVKLTAEGNLEHHYFMAVSQQEKTGLRRAETMKLAGGTYLSFIYCGHASALKEFISYIYLIYLPTKRITRREGPDIELFYLNGTMPDDTITHNNNIKCDYLIPVVDLA
ncbi:helix-turn-helix domain-containing protein [Acerihabitans arboris]|nr:helix-turn-helix domain-containing protein [Acerihabitans arboris]